MSAAAGVGGTGRHIAYVLRSNPITALAAACTTLLVVMAILAPWIAPL